MRCNNGMLRDEQDATLRIRCQPLNRELSWEEYLPVVLLGILALGFLVGAIFYF